VEVAELELVIELESLPEFVGVVVCDGVLEGVDVCVDDGVLLGVSEADESMLEVIETVDSGVGVLETDTIRLGVVESVEGGVIDDEAVTDEVGVPVFVGAVCVTVLEGVVVCVADGVLPSVLEADELRLAVFDNVVSSVGELETDTKKLGVVEMVDEGVIDDEAVTVGLLV